MPEEGNTEQSMRIADAIAGAVAASNKEFIRQLEESRSKSPGERALQWLPLILAAGTAFWQVAIASKQIELNAANIAKLEARNDQTQLVMQSVDSRLARIETTLDIVTGGKPRENQYARDR